MMHGYIRATALTCVGVLLFVSAALAEEGPAVDDSPGRAGEWGFRPRDGESSPVNPPGFVWRPQRGAVSYDLEAARDAAFEGTRYGVEDLAYNCHCPPKGFEAGRWHWRFRFRDKNGRKSAWSKTRWFEVGEGAVSFPMPRREELLGRIPRAHPRLFVRPEELSKLRQLAQGERKAAYRALVEKCEDLMRNPPTTKEPRKYPDGMTRGSDPWRDIWWGNRRYTINVLNAAATLAFTRLLGGREEYGQLAKRLLLETAEWDPKGSTGYRYNDEAGMPYNYYFSRTYTFVNDLLTEEEKARCREVMTVRGREMYAHLSPRHLWRPYSSHSNRAWHFLGEVGIAFLGEIPEAEEWVWFAMNVFFHAYPVWSDSDGGWHEGVSYWSSYINRFTWWADVMRVAMRIDAYQKPYFSQIGFYPMYLQPPGTTGGGFGDLTARRTSRDNRALMSIFSAQAGNPYWRWYVDAHGEPRQESGYIGFIRGALPNVEAKAPTELPTSRCFRGTGQAVLNTNLLDARENVEVIFKSSPFGTQSHGYEAQNSFLLYAFGERLLIRTGRRDSYGSLHHREWMWHTKSTNSITVNGESQGKRVASAIGEITAFHTSDAFDYVVGEAGGAYGRSVKQFTRRILFVKPELIIVHDSVEAAQPAIFDWWLHSPTEMRIDGQRDIRVRQREAACRVSFLAPGDLELTLTNKFDPPPRPRIRLVEWHLKAQTKKPSPRVEFVTVIRPHRAGETPPTELSLKEVPGGYVVEAKLTSGRAMVFLRASEEGTSDKPDLASVRLGEDGKPERYLTVEGETVRAGTGVSFPEL